MRRFINKTVSIWTYVNKNRIEFINPFYSPNPELIQPACDELSIQLWREHFLMWSETTKYKQSENFISGIDQIEKLAKSVLEREQLTREKLNSVSEEYRLYKKSVKS